MWGVCDMDTFFGSFERNFPWDEAEKYDMVFPSGPSDNGDQLGNLLYIPGHLGFYRVSEHLVDEFMRFPQVATYDAFFAQNWMDSGAPGKLSLCPCS